MLMVGGVGSTVDDVVLHENETGALVVVEAVPAVAVRVDIVNEVGAQHGTR